MDAGEDAAAAAVRELREETGYSGSVAAVSPVCYSDPGMTDASMQVVTVHHIKSCCKCKTLTSWPFPPWF